MKKSRLLSMAYIGAFLVVQTASFEVAAAFLSEVNLHGELFDPTPVTVGGVGVYTATLSDTGSDELDVGGTRSISASTLASAETGRIAFNLSSTISVDPEAAQGRLSAFVQSTNNRVIDEFMIGAGGELFDGESAQVRLQIQLDGIVQAQGRPSGGLHLDFSFRAGTIPSPALPVVAEYDTGGLSPPQYFEIHEVWDTVLDVTVGDRVQIDAIMSGWINGTAIDPGLSGTNFMDVGAIFRISNLEGYDLSIISEAGAPTSPIPVPAAVWLFTSGLIGLIGVARRKA
jgi:hypothetical protein